MSIYYIDSICGSPHGDGSEQYPLDTHVNLNILSGDTVLFKRGSEFRGGIFSPSGEDGKPITYGAYGEGEKPKFYGSINRSERDMWEETAPNIWRLKASVESEVCNLIFDYGESWGILAWEKEGLDRQGKWCYNACGCKDNPPKNASLYLFSEGNPAERYKNIEIAVYGNRCLASGRRHVRFEGLRFTCSGVHGYAQTMPEDIKITDCAFDFIGGCVWSCDRKIRFGNAVEFWNGASDCEIKSCSFDNIYDSCFTTQGAGEKCGDFINISVVKCSFYNYGMAAYEIRDKIGKNVCFENNICDGAGGGFSIQDETPPRNSEIYPELMGHHIFAWRIDNPTESGCVSITGNSFRGKPLGETYYRMISDSASAQIKWK